MNTDIQVNQLQFHMGIPITAGNMAAKFRSPQPILVEKLGAGGARTPLEVSLVATPNQETQKTQAFEFSAIDEDRMALARRLAKRDLERQKQQELVNSMQEKKESKRRSNVKKKPMQCSPAVDRSARRRNKTETPQKARKKPKSRPTTPIQAIVHITSQPAAPVSPPVRDTDPYRPRREPSQERRLHEEITRLRKDMHTCMSQIQQLDLKAKRGPLKYRPLPGTEDLPPEEQQRRLALKSEETNTRMSRTLYGVQQQVKEIQEEIMHGKPGQPVSNKKDHVLRRLAAAHRAVVRALQAFQQQVADGDISAGTPRAYRQLVLVVRQLALCSAHFELTGDSAQADSVAILLKDMLNMNDAMEQELLAAEPEENSRRSRHVGQSDRPHSPSRARSRSAERPSGKENRAEWVDVWTEKQPPPVVKRTIPALVCGRRTPPEVPRLAITPRTPHGPNERDHHARAQIRGRPSRPVSGRLRGRQKKSVMLPSALRERRERIARAVAITGPSHYSEPTIATELKKRQPHEMPQQPAGFPSPPLSPTRSPRVSPRRSGHVSPHYDYLPSVRSCRTPRPSARSASHTTPRSILSPRRTASPFNTARKEIAKQVMMDRDLVKRRQGLDELKQTEKKRLTQLRSNLNDTEEFVKETERRIRDKIQPLLHDAQVEVNSDVLADMILHDVLEETVCDLQELEDEEGAEELAWHMQQAPSINNLIRRLQEMEEEQEKIRQKWSTMIYEDEYGHPRASYQDAVGCERPSTPPPIQLTRQDPSPRQLTPTSTRLMRVAHPHDDQEELPAGLYFTRPAQDTCAPLLPASAVEKVAEGLAKTSRRQPTDSRLQLMVSAETVRSVHDYVARFESHLQRGATRPVGNFDSWFVVNQLSDAILSDCVEDVARELEEINSDVVNHIYQSEFQKPDD